MLPNYKEIKLINIYFYVTDLYDNELKYLCQRFSNNNEPEFTDQEIITIYLFAMHQEQRFKIRHIYKFASDYLRSWFPKLPSYVAFNTRLNRLSEVFKHMALSLLSNYQPSDCDYSKSLLDSLPIMTCSGKRSAKVARELTDKTFCSTKNQWYFGLKLHALAFRVPGKIPFPESLILTPASENDLNVFKQYWSVIEHRTFFGDKIYHDSNYFEALFKQYKIIMLTPVKGIKNQAQALMQRDKAANDLFSTAVSRIRQPIESFFNWLIEKTDIQRASKVRSTNGLLVHVFGRLAVAFLGLIFNS
jgi:hypothetical protein